MEDSSTRCKNRSLTFHLSTLVAILATAYGEIHCIGQKVQTGKFC